MILAYLVDLPGYGYAAVNHETKYHWNNFHDYLQEREQLVGMVLIVDPGEALLSWTSNDPMKEMPTGKPIHVLLSKDKLNKSECKHVLEAVRKQLQQYDPALPDGNGESKQLTAQLFSLNQAHWSWKKLTILLLNGYLKQRLKKMKSQVNSLLNFPAHRSTSKGCVAMIGLVAPCKRTASLPMI